MADILIKGMEMSKGDIPLVLIIMSDGTVEEIDDSDEINATDAKAIELPPHGRLIDADELPILYPSIENAPTIVEAST